MKVLKFDVYFHHNFHVNNDELNFYFLLIFKGYFYQNPKDTFFFLIIF